MEYVSIILSIIVIILVVILLFRKNDNSDMTERLGRFELSINKEMNDNFNKLNDKIQKSYANSITFYCYIIIF